jgi:hypothetical protein
MVLEVHDMMVPEKKLVSGHGDVEDEQLLMSIPTRSCDSCREDNGVEGVKVVLVYEPCTNAIGGGAVLSI